MLSAFDLLNSLEGIAYIIDPSGRIIDICHKGWSKSAIENGMPELSDPQSYIGRSIFDSISGESVRHFYRGLIDDLVSQKRDVASFAFRCDAPSRRREMRMFVSPITSSGVNRALLFHVLPISETIRPPINLFDHQAILDAIKANASLPFVVVCSFCHLVCIRAAADGEAADWVEAEEYYSRGGSSNVQLSHGLCPSCAERMNRPILDTAAERSSPNC